MPNLKATANNGKSTSSAAGDRDVTGHVRNIDPSSTTGPRHLSR
jgi:hypothetical protein